LFSPIDAKKAIRGVKIIVSGKINAANRARQAVLQDGIIPTQSFNKNVNYSLAHARLQTGAFGIKV
jgi:ribosomal protein S3